MLDENRVIQLLGATEIFSKLEEKHLAAIAKACRVVKFEERARIVSQGDTGHELFIIAQGSTSIVLEDADLGTERQVLKLGVGESFGEVSLLAESARSATVRATMETICVTLAKNSFASVLRQIPEVGVEISRYLAARLHHQCQLTGFRFVSFAELNHDPELQALFPTQLLKSVKAVPLELSDGVLKIAMVKPTDAGGIAALQDAVPGLSIEPLACTTDDFTLFSEQYLDSAESSLPVLRKDSAGAPFQLSSGVAVDKSLDSLFKDMLTRKVGQVILQFGDSRARILDPSGNELKELANFADAEQAKELQQAVDSTFYSEQSSGIGRHELQLGAVKCECAVSKLKTTNGCRYSIALSEPSDSIASLKTLFAYAPLREKVLSHLTDSKSRVLVTGSSSAVLNDVMASVMQELCTELSFDNTISLVREAHPDLKCVPQVLLNSDSAGSLALAQSQSPRLISFDCGSQEELMSALETAGQHSLMLTLSNPNSLEVLGDPRIHSGLDVLVRTVSLNRQCPHCRREFTPSPAVVNALQRAGLAEEGQVFFQSQGCDACRGRGVLGKVQVVQLVVLDSFLKEMIHAGRAEDAIYKAATNNKLIIPFAKSAKLLLRKGELGVSEALRLFGGHDLSL